MTRSHPLRAGVIGLGYGAEVHLPVLMGMPDVEVVGIASRDAEKARATADAAGVSQAFGHSDELLGLDLDLVTLALPPMVNERVAEQALGRDLAVLSEKPIASTAEAAHKLAELSIGKTTGVGFQFIELRTFQALKKVIGDEKLGRLRGVRVDWLTNSRANRDQSWSWKTDAGRNGGILTSMGAHVLFLVEWLFGRIGRVEASLDSSSSSRFAPAGDTAAADSATLALHAEAAPVRVAISNASSGPLGHRWTMDFEEGTATLEEVRPIYLAGLRLTVKGKGDAEVFEEAPESTDGRQAPFRALAERFVQATSVGAEVWPNFHDGARVQTLIDRVVESARRGEAVAVGSER